MSTEAFKLTIHMVSSLDGFIAKNDNTITWLDTTEYYEKGIELSNDEQNTFLKSIDCYIMGSGTYEHAVELAKTNGWAYGDTPTIVISQRDLIVNKENVQIYSGNLSKLIKEQLQHKYKNVWLVGGAKLVKEFMRLNLVDEIRISILPILLGDGIPFFENLRKEHLLKLKDVTAYKTGMVELLYSITNK
jgi:dihydrofolate reductase